MKAIKQKNRQASLFIILIGCLFLFWVPCVSAQNSTSEMSVDDPLFVEGVVRYYSLEKQVITVKPSKQERVKIQVDGQTVFVRMPNLEDLKKGQRIKVWYTAIGDIKIAAKIERLPDLGC